MTETHQNFDPNENKLFGMDLGSKWYVPVGTISTTMSTIQVTNNYLSIN